MFLGSTPPPPRMPVTTEGFRVVGDSWWVFRGKSASWGFSGSFRRCDPWHRPRIKTPLRLQHRSKAKYQVNVLLMAENPVNSPVEVKVGSLSIYHLFTTGVYY